MTTPDHISSSAHRGTAFTVLARLAVVVVAGTLVLLTAYHRLSARGERASEPVEFREIASRVQSPAVLRFGALGHHEAMADLVWLNALSFFGEHFGLRKDARWLFPHLEAITGLDPRFSLVYAWAGTATMYGSEISNETVLASCEILERGVEQFPLAWDIRFMLGVNYAFELRTRDPELHAQWRRTGAEHIARAAALPNAPQFLSAAAASLLAGDDNVAEFLNATVRGYLWSAPDATQFALASQLRRNFRRTTSVTTIAQAEMIAALSKHPDWALSPATAMLVLHPDPILGTLPAGQP